MSGGMLLLTITAVLIFSGLLQRVLDRMYLTDRQALVLVGLMIIGTFLPHLSIGFVSINIGGGGYTARRMCMAVREGRSTLGTGAICTRKLHNGSGCIYNIAFDACGSRSIAL